MRTRRLPLRLIAPIALVALLALLATLQYRWLGQVADADREQKQQSLHQRAESFAEDFDRELSKLYMALQSASTTLPEALDNAAVPDFARHYDTWRERAKFPEFVRAVYVADSSKPEGPLKEYRPERQAFAEVPWPPALAEIQRQMRETAARTDLPDTGRAILLTHEAVMPSVPAIRVAQFGFQPGRTNSAAGSMMSVAVNARILIAYLDRDFIQAKLLPALAAQYFPDREADSYRFAVLDAKNPSAPPVFSHNVPDGTSLTSAKADASVSLFSLRMDLVASTVSARATNSVSAGTGAGTITFAGRVGGAAGMHVSVPAPSPSATPPQKDVRFVVQTQSVQPRDVLTVSMVETGWKLVLQHTAGSLDVAVAQVRTRNLWLSFGILSVLALGVGLVVVSAQRAERLAGQQMDFVATVSHELRTPLAVIRSAAQNLSAGVVHDASQAKRYGDLIDSEGRRLTDMVEQVLEYAGLSANRRSSRSHLVDAAAVVRDTVDSCQDLLTSEHFETTVEIPTDLPPVLADEDAVRRAVQNLVTNAVKYGADGRVIKVGVTRAPVKGRDELHISVADRGRGIDADDLPHIFDPFYRGRYAIDRQIRGNGLGLSLVKRIAEAHGGRISVVSAPGEGATFTLSLPVATPRLAPGQTAATSVPDLSSAVSQK